MRYLHCFVSFGCTDVLWEALEAFYAVYEQPELALIVLPGVVRGVKGVELHVWKTRVTWYGLLPGEKRGQ